MNNGIDTNISDGSLIRLSIAIVFLYQCIFCCVTYSQNNIYVTSVSRLPVEKHSDTLALSIDSVKNALIKTDDVGWVRLHNGSCEYEATSPKLKNRHYEVDIYIKDILGFADLNGDGYKDAICQISENSGGSGCYLSLLIFINNHGSAKYTAEYFFGDREGADSVEVHGDTIHVYYTTHGPNDPMATPSVKEDMELRLVGNELIKIDE